MQLIKAGKVRVDGHVVTRPAEQVDEHSRLDVDEERWVSRAAHKLLAALDESGLVVGGRVLDAGASTGGFTQVCVEYGAQRVYAVDVGHDQLAQSLRADPRVVVREGLNLRDLTLADLDDLPVDLIVCDVSFISVRLLLPVFSRVLACHGKAMIMIKPQFEVGRTKLGAHGIVTDPAVRNEAIAAVIDDAYRLGWVEIWQADSTLPGEFGNREYFVCFTPSE